MTSQVNEATTNSNVSKYADLLNSLNEMQASPAYALRRQVLVDAEWLITRLESEITAKDAAIEHLKMRVREQTDFTQKCGEYHHNNVLDMLRRKGVLLDTIDPHGHPIEQIVGTCVSALLSKLEFATTDKDGCCARCGRYRQGP